VWGAVRVLVGRPSAPLCRGAGSATRISWRRPSTESAGGEAKYGGEGTGEGQVLRLQEERRDTVGRVLAKAKYCVPAGGEARYGGEGTVDNGGGGGLVVGMMGVSVERKCY